MLAPHLLCAAYEAPLTDADLELFGGAGARALADALEAEGALRRRRDGLRPGSGRSQADQVDIRNAGGSLVTIVAADSGQVIGTVDRARAPSTVHRGAVYLHQGENFRVAELDLDDGVALVTEAKGDEYTQARSDVDVTVVEPTRRVELPRSTLWLGRVDVSEQVVGYERRRVGTGELLGYEDLDLPPARLQTVAYWYTLSPGLLDAAALDTEGHPRRRPRRRARPDRAAPPVRHVRPLGHRRPLHRLAPRHRARPRSSSTTATPAAPASPSRATAAPSTTSAPPATPSRPAPARPAAPPASSPPSAATATTPSTRPAPSACWTSSWRTWGPAPPAAGVRWPPPVGRGRAHEPARGGRAVHRGGGGVAAGALGCWSRPRASGGGWPRRGRWWCAAAGRGHGGGLPGGPGSAGGTTVGLLPGLDRGDGNPHLSVSVPTGLGQGRNLLLVRSSDALVAVGGGFGTLSEIALALRTGVPVVGLATWSLQLDASPVEAFPVAGDADTAARLALEAARSRPTRTGRPRPGPAGAGRPAAGDRASLPRLVPWVAGGS